MTPRFHRNGRRLLALTVLWLAFAAALSAAERGMLWRIERDGRVSHLLGTIHVSDPRVLALPAPVERAFAAARTFCAEVELDMGNLLGLGQAMLLPPEESLREKLDADTWRELVAVAAGLGLPAMMLERMKPWAVATLLSQPRGNGMVLDVMLYNRAAEAGKALCGLETPAEQIGALEAMTEEQQIAMLRSALRQHGQLDRLVERLVQAWLARDLAALVRISNETLREADAGMVAAFEREVVVRRNRRMVERMVPKLQAGDVFVAVGALHLPGEEGLLNLLRKRGYRVSPVY